LKNVQVFTRIFILALVICYEQIYLLKISSEKRAVYIVKKERLPDENPKEFYYTPDRIEWKFLQTLPNEEQMKKFCGENHCPYKPQSIRFPCNRKLSHNCKFMLLKLKTTQLGYHVYKHGEHNSHSAIDK
jgi:hypothetical protein